MTDRQINVAIAELCPDTFQIHSESGTISMRDGLYWKDVDVTTDLNAMHEAEKTLSDEEHEVQQSIFSSERQLYIDALEQVVTPTVDEENIYYASINATAHQRAEAFLRVKGKRVEK